MEKEHRQRTHSSERGFRGRTRLLAAAALTAVVAIGGTIASMAIRATLSSQRPAARVSWTGVVDRIEAGKVVVIPHEGVGGAAVPRGERDGSHGEVDAPRAEVVMPAILLPPTVCEGAVLDFSVISRHGETQSRAARVEALVLRLNRARRN
ncbi:MAG: DUF3006 domain-containing protein [Firmicutes bacterium]|jgi:hypothetical protein|nr:DUF3006 domain-containing protein [Bacillota bacterium]MDH7496468.1 hypothetical protein [Bacillota bacterium]